VVHAVPPMSACLQRCSAESATMSAMPVMLQDDGSQIMGLSCRASRSEFQRSTNSGAELVVAESPCRVLIYPNSMLRAYCTRQSLGHPSKCLSDLCWSRVM
jgi:hypothetical protein